MEGNHFLLFWHCVLFHPKAQQSRQKFLNEHMVKVDKDAIEEENGDEEQPEEKDISSSEIRKYMTKEVLFQFADCESQVKASL